MFLKTLQYAMENRESSPFNLYREQYDLLDKRPKTVQKQTAFWIDLYMKEDTMVFPQMRDYLQDYTIPFISNIGEGLKHFAKLAQIKDKKYLDSIIAKNEPKLPATATEKEQDAMEAFDLALTTFSYLPYNTTIKIGPTEVPYSARGTMKPPQTVEEFLWRTYELYHFTAGMIDGSLQGEIDNKLRGSVVRPVAFFKTGADIPLSRSGLERDKQQGPDVRSPKRERIIYES